MEDKERKVTSLAVGCDQLNQALAAMHRARSHLVYGEHHKHAARVARYVKRLDTWLFELAEELEVWRAKVARQ